MQHDPHSESTPHTPDMTPDEDGWIYPEALGGEIRIRESTGSNGLTLPDGVTVLVERKKPGGGWKRLDDEEAAAVLEQLQQAMAGGDPGGAPAGAPAPGGI